MFTERDLWAEFAAIHNITKPHRTMRPIPENTAVSMLISIILYGQKQVRDGLTDDPPCEGTKHDGGIVAGIAQHPQTKTTVSGYPRLRVRTSLLKRSFMDIRANESFKYRIAHRLLGRKVDPWYDRGGVTDRTSQVGWALPVVCGLFGPPLFQLRSRSACNRDSIGVGCLFAEQHQGDTPMPPRRWPRPSQALSTR